MVRVAVAIVIVSILACTGGTEPEVEEEPPVDQVVPGTEEQPKPAVEVKPGFFTAGWALWRAPTDEKKIPNPDGDGTVKNYMHEHRASPAPGADRRRG